MPIKTIQAYIAIAVIVAIVLTIGVLVYKNKSLTKELDETNYKLTQALIINKQMEISVTKQNEAIDNLNTAAINNQKKHETELKAAKEKAQVIKSDATKILVKTIPQGSTGCEAALQLINEEVLK